jgi:drug/metabolite transporter (DMT)-like permease
VEDDFARSAVLGAGGGAGGRAGGLSLDSMTANLAAGNSAQSTDRRRALHRLGIICGLSAGAWLGAAEAPTKLVQTGVSPVVISLLMVVGVFLARWGLPTLVRGTGQIYRDAAAAPHLIVWAVLAGCLWAVANTLTIFAVRDIGLGIAFPLWNSNSLLGILWGYVFFNELRSAGWRRWLGVCGGALLMFGGALLLAEVSTSGSGSHSAARGIVAAVSAGVLWGTMYIPYRKAYLTGMNPLSFVTFFTFGELGMMAALAVSVSGGLAPLWREIMGARGALFWLMLGGFVWVIGDLFQQYAAKYVGISRGIPLSNTNQLWGLLWAILVFGEFQGKGAGVYQQVAGGSVLMALGAGVISISSAAEKEREQWRQAAERECIQYGTDAEYIKAGFEGRKAAAGASSRGPFDWMVMTAVVIIFCALAWSARAPQIAVNWPAAIVLAGVLVVVLAACGLQLRRVTGFN